MRPTEFSKMSGAGNDFIVFLGGPPDPDIAWVRSICRRRHSVGADGVLFVEAISSNDGLDRVAVRFYNPDGSRAFCGNGSRCAARYAHIQGIAGTRMELQTDLGSVPAVVGSDGSVELTLPLPRDLGAHRLDPAPGADIPDSWLWIDSGVPHAICMVSGIADIPLEQWAPPVRSHPHWGEAGANVNLLEPVGTPGYWHLRTFERGVEGETLACGSGAVAAAWAIRDTAVEGRVTLIPTGKVPLQVNFVGGPSGITAVQLLGDALHLFRGTLTGEEAR